MFSYLYLFGWPSSGPRWLWSCFEGLLLDKLPGKLDGFSSSFLLEGRWLTGDLGKDFLLEFSLFFFDFLGEFWLLICFDPISQLDSSEEPPGKISDETIWKTSEAFTMKNNGNKYFKHLVSVWYHQQLPKRRKIRSIKKRQ